MDTCEDRTFLSSHLVALLAATVFSSSIAFADVCTDPFEPEGIRTCDFFFSGCPEVWSDLTNQPEAKRADYSTVREAETYLTKLDVEIDDGIFGDPINYLEIIDLGISTWLILALDDNGPAWEDDAVMTAVRLTEDAEESDVTPDKPAVLMICGVHAQEWMPQETCLGYVDWLVKAANGYESTPEDEQYAQELLAERELWSS